MKGKLLRKKTAENSQFTPSCIYSFRRSPCMPEWSVF